MKEALSMTSNELNLIDIAWTTGYVIGQLPSQLILTKVRPSIWIPSCELVWTLLTFCLAGATTSGQVMAIRFFVGLVESIFYPAAHFLIGSWYKPSELGKRACIFHASAAAAGMFSGYLQAAVYNGLDGTLGKAGWQWLFIMDGLISLPICISGFFLIPDLPENTRAFYLTGDDAALARKRMHDVGRAPRRKLGWSILRRVFTRWHVYALTVLYIIFINTGPSSSVNPFALWLKDKGYPVTKIVRFLTSPHSNFRSLTTAEYHPNRRRRHPAGNNSHIRYAQRFPAQPASRNVVQYPRRLLLRLLSSDLEHPRRPQMVSILRSQGSCTFWPSRHVMGQ
jgi:ACS family pantothenate transporter-like MFS transporter